MIQEVIIDLANFLLGTSAPVPVSILSFAKPSEIPLSSACKAINNSNIKIPGLRICCALGFDNGSVINKVNGKPPNLTSHVYIPTGPNVTFDSGYIYTRLGGLIDIGHVRDNADMTRYITTNVFKLYETGGTIDIGVEVPIWEFLGNKRKISINRIGSPPSTHLASLLGAYIAYQIAVWHEISTFEDASCFSPEDNYSNIIGCYIGYKACLDTHLPYEAAVKKHLNDILFMLDAKETQITKEVLRLLENKWYPQLNVLSNTLNTKLLKRHVAYTPVVSPWLISDVINPLPATLSSLSNPTSILRTQVFLPQNDDGSAPLDTFFKFKVEEPKNMYFDFTPFCETPKILDSSKFPEIISKMKKHFTDTQGLNSVNP